MPFLSSQSTCIQRNVVLIGAILFLVGCGGTEYRAKTAETGRSQLFLDANDVIGRIEGLSEVTIYSTGILSGSVRKVRLMAEREAPFVKTDTIKVSKADPVLLSLTTLLSLGIYPILAPGKAWDTLVGKDEVTSQVESVDYSKAKSTGRYRWQGIQGNQSETINVSVGYGLKTSHTFIANFNSKSEANFSIDVAKLISQRLQESNDSEIIVSITCSCLWVGSQADATTENLKLRPTLNIQLTKAAYPSLFKRPEPPPQKGEARKPKRGMFKDF